MLAYARPAKAPEECRTLAEVRAEIDRIDREIVRAIGKRRHYVMAAAGFKKNEAEVSAPDRFAAMLQARREWAEQEGLSSDAIEKLYRDLVTYFIEEERAHWSTQRV